MRSRDPSTTRTWTFSVSPGRKPGMSERSEAASKSSSVFIAVFASSFDGHADARRVGSGAGVGGPRGRPYAHTPPRAAVRGGPLRVPQVPIERETGRLLAVPGSQVRSDRAVRSRSDREAAAR